MNSIIFCRRLPSLQFSGFYSSSLKCIQYQGNWKYFRNYSKSLLRHPFCSANLNLYPVNCSEGTFKRIKHTSADQKPSADPKTNPDDDPEDVEDPPEKLSLFKRYKKMLKEYWYVLLPVHCVTSAFWFGGFYYAATCGIDIIPFLEYINLPETLIKPLRNSSLGYIAVASAIYKLATPARYMVTLGGTTFAIKFLTKRGLIKPVPSRDRIKTMIQNKLKKDTKEKEA